MVRRALSFNPNSAFLYHERCRGLEGLGYLEKTFEPPSKRLEGSEHGMLLLLFLVHCVFC
jgi:hypothetical protein